MAQFPLFQKFQKAIQHPPALSLGLPIFLTVIFLLSQRYVWIEDDLELRSTALTNFELNRISFYPLVHATWFHLLLNLVALQPIVSQFERVNGTVRTGIVLNILAVVTAIPWCLLSIGFFPDEAVLGSSAWIFSFMGYWAIRESSKQPTTQLAPNLVVPTWLLPIIYLVVIAIVIPSSSFIGHLLGLIAGWMMALGYLDVLIEPSSKVVLWIEKKISRVIDLIPSSIVTFYREEGALDTRAAARADTNRSLSVSGGNFLGFQANSSQADLEAGTRSRGNSSVDPTTSFPGTGQTLGTQ
ncbi:YALIA101S01e02806g1_1 [Yarrowia lipolytica]|nr:Rhomboid protein 2 [Yarrowia lipolytica]SEI30587.1 YALIA101S01e02806g1_1 [Yarrowia lipolytica]